MPCPFLRLARSVLVALLLGCPALAQASGFAPGELILSSPGIPGLPTTNGGIVRIDPATGVASVLVDVWETQNRSDSVAYDPFRERLILYGRLVSAFDSAQVYLLDGFGNATSLGNDDKKVHGFAPASGGRIYFLQAQIHGIQYFDASNQQHTLMDASGTQPFVPQAAEVRQMEYDAGTNSLFIGVSKVSPWNCGAASSHSRLIRLQLSDDGSRVLAQSGCIDLVVDPNWGSSPMGLSHGPDGDLVATILTGSGATSPRILQIDPASLNVTTYAWTEAPATKINAGCWSSILGEVVIFDSFADVLRSFAAGTTGAGTVINTSIPIGAGGSAENATLVEVVPEGCGSLVGTYCTAKVTSGGCLPQIGATGSPSATAASGFTLSAGPLNAQVVGIFFYGWSGAAATPFQGGTVCAQPPLRRTPPVVSGGAGACGGTLSIDFNAYLAGGGNPQLGAGSVVYGQFWFRDPPHPVGGSGLSNAVTFTLCP